MKKYMGVFGLIVVTIVWGGGFPASEIALESATPFQIMVARFFMASIAMTLIGWKQVRKIKKSEVFSGFFLGCALFAAFALQLVGLQFTTPSKNAFLTATNVVIVPFIAFIVYKKKIAKKNLIGAAMAIAGAGVLSLQNDFSINIGDLLTLLCAVGFAFQIFLTGEFVGKIRPAILNFMQMITACVLSLLVLIVIGDFEINITTESFLAILYLGLISTTLCYLLQTVCQKYVDETKAAIILSMESVFGTLFSVWLLGEAVTTRMIVGSVLILSAVIVSEVKVGEKTNR